MFLHRTLALVILSATLGACSTTQQVTMAKTVVSKPIRSVAPTPADGNSTEMDQNLETALVREGLTVKPRLPAGVQTTPGADAVVSYIDVWRWDLVMYIQRLTVKIQDAQTGDLIAMGEWKDSPLHGFRNAKDVMGNLVAEMMDKIRTATKAD